MTQKPLHPCYHPSCHSLTRERYCEKHKTYTPVKRSSAAMGYGYAWRKARKRFLEQNPLCADCGKFADVVDHEIPHKGDEALFWDSRNWTPRCTSCHNRKTRMEDMGAWSNKLGYK